MALAGDPELMRDSRFEFFTPEEHNLMTTVIDQGARSRYRYLQARNIGNLITELNKALSTTNAPDGPDLEYLDDSDVETLMSNISKVRDERAKAKQDQDAGKPRDASTPQPLSPGGQ